MNKNIIYIIAIFTSTCAVFATINALIFAIVVAVDKHKETPFESQIHWNTSHNATINVSLRRFHEQGPNAYVDPNGNNYSAPFSFKGESNTFIFNRANGYNNYILYADIRRFVSTLATNDNVIPLIGGGPQGTAQPLRCGRHWNQRAAAIWGYLFIELLRTPIDVGTIATSPIDSINPCLLVNDSRIHALVFTRTVLPQDTVAVYDWAPLAPLGLPRGLPMFAHLAAVGITTVRSARETYIVIASLDENTHRIRCDKCHTHYAVDERGPQIIDLTRLNYTTIMPQSYNIISLKT